MMEFIQFNDGSENRGQVGIGTLIVFIAMVLVAAIAAGVLVNTAGFLQATAEETGQESVDQVTQRLDVVNEHGTVGDSDNIKSINLTVGLSSGSDALDLENTTIKYVSDGSVATLTHGGTANGNMFITSEVNGNSGNTVLTDTGDRYAVKISTSDIEGGGGSGEGLNAGDTVQLEITTEAGGTTTAVLTMPNQLADSSNNDPVPL